MGSSIADGSGNCGNVERETEGKTADHDWTPEGDIVVQAKLEPQPESYMDFHPDLSQTDPLSLSADESEPREHRGESPAPPLERNAVCSKKRKKCRRSKFSTARKKGTSGRSSTTCPYCAKRFELPRQVYRHIRVVHDNDPVKCEDCGKTYKNKELRRVHFRRVHAKAGATGAKVGTDRNTRTQIAQDQHQFIARIVQPPPLQTTTTWTWEQVLTPVTSRVEFIICDCCGISFQNKDNFVQHSKLHKPSDSTWKCKLCNKYFRTERHLLKHKKKAHLTHETNMVNKSSTYAHTTQPMLSAIEEIEDSIGNVGDDWFENAPSENSTPLEVEQVHMGIDTEINSLQISVEDKLSVQDLITCSKLKMNAKVLVQKYNPPVWRRGHVFCDLCCRNFRSTHFLKFHMNLVHGIEYREKKTTPRIKKILAEMRGHAWKCPSVRNGARIRKTKESSDESAGLELEAEKLAAETTNNIKSDTGKVLGERVVCTFSSCRRTFRSKAKLQYHIGLVHEDSPRKCRICEKVFPDSHKLWKHMHTVHEGVTTEPTPSPCDVCGIVFDSHRKANLHKKRVHDERPRTLYNCKECGKSYQTPRALYGHTLAWHKNQNIMCNQCGKSFTHKATLLDHLTRVHNEPTARKCKNREPESFQCEDCGRTFKQRDAYSSHRKVKHLKEKNYRCLFCNVRTYTSRLKRLHEVQYHGSPTGYGCKICDQFCETPNALEKHVLYDHSKAVLEGTYYGPAQWIDPPATKTTSLLGRFTIQYESQVGRNKLEKYQNPFMSAEEFKARQDWSNRNNPRDCAFCGVTCGGRTEEAKHNAEVHPDYAEHRCTECRLAFPDLRRYNQHMERLHAVKNKRSIIAEVDKSRLFGCGFCPKYFISQAGMERHKESVHPNSAAVTN